MSSKGGSAPQPVDPYQQAAAQYGLSTGTAEFNAGLNRTNTVNPLGSSTWSTSTQGMPNVTPSGGTPGIPGYGGYGGYYGGYGLGGGGLPTGSPPTYTQTTTLQPWLQQSLSSPIDTQGLPGMPGGPDIMPYVNNVQNAVFGNTMGYIQPEQQLAQEQLDSQLANSGAAIGSPVYNTEQARLGRQQAFQTNQAANAATMAGPQVAGQLYGLGSQALQNQITARNAPLSEYESLLTGAQPANAQTPDIMGAFNQQYQGALNAYNAQTASSNAAMGDASSLIGAYLMYLALA